MHHNKNVSSKSSYLLNILILLLLLLYYYYLKNFRVASHRKMHNVVFCFDCWQKRSYFSITPMRHEVTVLHIAMPDCMSPWADLYLILDGVEQHKARKKNIECDMHFDVNIPLCHVHSSCSLFHGHRETCEDIIPFFLVPKIIIFASSKAVLKFYSLI